MSNDPREGQAPSGDPCSGHVAGIGTCFMLLGLCLFGPGQPRAAAMDGTEGETMLQPSCSNPTDRQPQGKAACTSSGGVRPCGSSTAQCPSS